MKPMKKMIFTLAFMAALILFACPVALAHSNNALPQDIQAYFAADRFAGATILDRADLTGHGSDDCWFVLIREKNGENVLYCFRQNNGEWQERFHTSDAVPQTKHGVQINVDENGVEWPTEQTYSNPHLYIGQENDEGEYWEFTITFELQKGKWLLHRIWSYIGYESMLIRDGSISYYRELESVQIAGTVQGTIQRDLRYVSLSAIPKTLADARRKLTVAPELPESTELTVYPVTFAGKKKYDVYSAPDKNAIRGGNGKARVSTNSWIQVFGTENGWVLIQYSIDASHYRFGYITEKSLPGKAAVPALGFNRTEAWIKRLLFVTDDPLYSQSILFTLPEGSRVIWLATMGDWAYIESTGKELARGFVPVTELYTNMKFDLGSILIDATSVWEGTLTVDLSSGSVQAHIRPAAGGELEGKPIGGYDFSDPDTHTVFTSIAEADQEGYINASFMIPQGTSAIQIQTLPGYGATETWQGQTVIVEW